MRPVIFPLAILLAAAPGIAQTYTYQFAGTINTIVLNENNAIPGVYLNQSFSGWFSYNSDSQTTEIGAIAFTLGEFESAVIDDCCLATVLNNPAPPTSQSNYDLFSALFYDIQDDYEFWRTGITLKDSTCTAFDSDQLPTDLILSMFSVARLDISGSKGEDDFNISGRITSLTQIPEPASLLILLSGTLCLRRKM